MHIYIYLCCKCFFNRNLYLTAKKLNAILMQINFILLLLYKYQILMKQQNVLLVMHFQNVQQKVSVIFAVSISKMDYGIELLIKIINLKLKNPIILASKQCVHRHYVVYTSSMIFEVDKKKQFNLLHKIKIQLL